MGNPLASLRGFPRAPAQADLATRRALARLAALADILVIKNYAATSAPAAVANTAAETAFGASYTFPANVLAPGNVVRVTARGVFSSTGGPPTLRLKVKLGSTVVLDTGVVTLANNGANALWTLDGLLVATAVGVSGTLECQGVATLYPAAGPQALPMVNTAAVARDTTPTLALTVTVQWGTAAAGNTATLRQLVIETLP